MRTKIQTSIHLLLASIVTIFGIFLILIIFAMSWEPWMVPIIVIGNSVIWCLHITRSGTDAFYENLCVSLLMIGFFFFGVHKDILYDIPAVACILVLIFSMFDKKRLLYLLNALYVLDLLYQGFFLRTIMLILPGLAVNIVHQGHVALWGQGLSLHAARYWGIFLRLVRIG